MKPYLITWKSGTGWHGKAITMGLSAILAWEKFLAKWHKDFENGDVDLNPNEIDSFSVEIAANEFVG
jgi:hypothetical protein